MFFCVFVLFVFCTSNLQDSGLTNPSTRIAIVGYLGTCLTHFSQDLVYCVNCGRAFDAGSSTWNLLSHDIKDNLPQLLNATYKNCHLLILAHAECLASLQKRAKFCYYSDKLERLPVPASSRLLFHE